MLLLFQFLISSASSTELTRYKWIAEEGKKYKGRCVEVDSSSEGRDFYRNVSKSKCRPKEEFLTTIWEQKPDGPGGKCYIVDKKTAGKSYSKISTKDICQPKSFSYELIEGKCYQHGTRTDGQVFLVSSLKKFCEPKNIEPQFVLRSNGFSGSCVAFDPQTNQRFRRALTDCRPKETIFQAVNVKGKTSCFEVAKFGGAQVYISAASLKKCKPSDTYLSWSQAKPRSGVCHLRSNTDTTFIQEVSALKCAELFKTKLYFEASSPIRGKCYIFDVESSGKGFQHPTSLERCRLKSIGTSIISYRNKLYCVEYDQENPEAGYRKKVNMTRCHSNSGEYQWVLSEKENTKGTCYQKYSIDNKKTGLKKIKTELCRPKLTIFKWILQDEKNPISGSCYEMAMEGGPSSYINEAQRKSCLPKKPTEVKFFHPLKYKNGGCYKIASDEDEVLYSLKVKYDLCKELLK